MSIVTSVAGAIIGLLLYALLKSLIPSTWFKIGIVLAFAAIGYGIATLRVPDSNNFNITRKTGGEKLDEVLLRALKFKMKGKRIYLYTKEEFKKWVQVLIWQKC